jgi:hypothetical protein
MKTNAPSLSTQKVLEGATLEGILQSEARPVPVAIDARVKAINGEKSVGILRRWRRHHGALPRLNSGPNGTLDCLSVTIHNRPQGLGQGGKQVERGQGRKQHCRARVCGLDDIEKPFKPSNGRTKGLEVFGVICAQ